MCCNATHLKLVPLNSHQYQAQTSLWDKKKMHQLPFVVQPSAAVTQQNAKKKKNDLAGGGASVTSLQEI